MELASSRLPISQLLLAISLSTTDSSWVPPLPTRTAVVSHRRCAAPAAADSGNISSAPRGGLRGLGGALRGAARSRSGATSGRGGRIAVAGGLLAALGLGGGAVAARRASRPLPVVLVHGILDCSENMYQVEAWVRASLGRGGHVLNVEIGNGVVDSIARPMDWQLQELAAAIRADPALAEGFNMIGYSQGALLARGYVQRYNLPRVSTLVSWVGPQAGQFGVPAWDEMIGHINKITSAMWYTPAIQERAPPERVSFANYWRDPMRLDTYRSNSAFLADLNNEVPGRRNESYATNLASLDAFVLVSSTIDSIIVPRESQWFGFFAPNSTSRIVPLRRSPLWTEDWIGLRRLDAARRLHFASCACHHPEGPSQGGPLQVWDRATRRHLQRRGPLAAVGRWLGGATGGAAGGGDDGAGGWRGAVPGVPGAHAAAASAAHAAAKARAAAADAHARAAAAERRARELAAEARA
ncbi:hypothetical protein EMIHUDRAFT_449336, partial [Emiliania huxleyi CCMP1516]|uniref:Palmitoyl-protein thioesterase 1 n=2 Tax=Emiliania huxleyi TaxID=2903 RepID=A0A0D3KEW9_EMIH1